jgi:hypothetical protein
VEKVSKNHFPKKLRGKNIRKIGPRCAKYTTKRHDSEAADMNDLVWIDTVGWDDADLQGSMLQNSLPAEIKKSDKFSSSNYGHISTQKPYI